MFGLFKDKLNPTDHLNIINYLIVEEAELQWNYHAIENNFDKQAFRSPSFAKGTSNMFITKILKMKVDENILSNIVDLGFRRCQEYIIEYKQNEKKYIKLTDEKLCLAYYSVEGYFDHISKKHSDLQGMNEMIMIQGKEAVNFGYRKQAYELIAETNRQFQLIIKTMFKKFTKEKTDEKIEKFKKKWNNLNEADRKKNIINLRNSIFDTIEDRNPNNLIS